MRLRHYVMEQKTDMGVSGTKVYDLDFADPITRLTLRLDASNGATDNKESPLERVVSKIEIVDGGEVLWSVPGDVAFATAVQLSGIMPHVYNSEVGSDTQNTTIPIQFGRYMYDEVFAFNPLAHKNPQLRVTFNEAEINSAGNDGFVSDSITMTLIAHLMEDAAAPLGFLALREIETFTSLDSGIRRISMPTDQVVRNIINRVYLTEIDVRNPISNYKLSVDGGKHVPFDWSSDAVLDFMSSMLHPVEYQNLITATDGAYTETWIGVDIAAALTCRKVGVIVGADGFWPGAALIRLRLHDNTAQTDEEAFMRVLGYALHNTLIIPMGDLARPETWLDPRGFNTMDMHLTNADASAEVNFCLQSVYQY